MGEFNGEILADKLAKLNNTQESIETLSNWCIVYRKEAKHVVETWDRQFHCCPQEQRLSFLYLANDILQNSRQKGLEFVAEFWNVLPNALDDVYENGDEVGRKAVLRLVGIWEERKVFGPCGHVLNEKLLGRCSEDKKKSESSSSYQLEQPRGDLFERFSAISKQLYDGFVGEDKLFRKVETATNWFQKAVKEGLTTDKEKLTGSEIEEVLKQHAILQECLDELKAVESSRTTFLSILNEAFLEQVIRVEAVRKEVRAFKTACHQLDRILLHWIDIETALDQRRKDTSILADLPPHIVQDAQASAGGKGESTPIGCTQQVLSSDMYGTGDNRKAEAVALVENLAASSSSAEILSNVLSSLSPEAVVGQMVQEDYPPNNKRSLVEDDMAPNLPSQNKQPRPLPSSSFISNTGPIVHPSQPTMLMSSLAPHVDMPPSSGPQDSDNDFQASPSSI